MDRKSIHNQISTLLDKINHLNDNVKEDKALHPVEVDLFLAYLKELHQSILKLTEQKPNATDEKLEDKTAEKETKLPESKSTEASQKNGATHVEIKFQNKTENLKEAKEERPETDGVKEDAKETKSTNEVRQEPQPEPSKPFAMPENFRQPQVNKQESLAEKKEKEAMLNDRFKNDSTEVAERIKQVTKRKLKDSIDLAQKYVYINELFQGNAEQFNKSLQELDQCHSVEEAEVYLKTLETKFPWDSKLKYAKLFKESVIQSIEL